MNSGTKLTNETVFKGSMDDVWMATERALAQYPISESNKDAGILKTDYLRGTQCWHSPSKAEKFSAGVRCSLSLQLVRISSRGIRVRIHKSLQVMRDFISEPESLPNDGMEEVHILYRIDRELTIAKEIAANHAH